MIGSDIQWGRYAEVNFTNFNSGLVTSIKSETLDERGVVIGDGLRITFEYTKNDDQGYNTPNGKIVIYGLTEKTYNSLGDRLRCEIELKAGYLKSKSNRPERLFYAVLMDKSYEIQDGTSVSTFSILGDFLEKMIASRMSQNLPKPTLTEIMIAISNSMGKGWGVKLQGTDEENEIVAEHLQKWKVSPYGYSFAGTPQQELKRLRDSFGISHQVDGDMVIFSIRQDWFIWHLSYAKDMQKQMVAQANTTLVAENKTAPEVKDFKPVDSKGKKINLIKTHALVLKTDTGLIGSPTIGNPIVDKSYDEALANGEEVWSKKQQTVVKDKKTGEVKKDKEGNVKMTKKPKKYKVARRTCVAKCYINSMINFNSMISIVTDSAITDGLYRVRSIKINGDTGGGDWYMELELNE